MKTRQSIDWDHSRSRLTQKSPDSMCRNSNFPDSRETKSNEITFHICPENSPVQFAVSAWMRKKIAAYRNDVTGMTLKGVPHLESQECETI